MERIEENEEGRLIFAKRLRQLRRAEELSQKELAEALGVPLARYGNWEQGRAVPSLLLLPKIAEHFRITVDKLLGVEPQGLDDELYWLIKHMPDDAKKHMVGTLKSLGGSPGWMLSRIG